MGRQHPISHVAALGVVAGMRSQLPLALLAFTAGPEAAGPDAGNTRASRWLPVTRGALGLAALGELIADKLPFVPNRNTPGPLAGRMVIGGIAGATLARRMGGSMVTGLLTGAAAAGLATFGAFHLRAAAGRGTGLPDPLFGAVEDGLAISLGLWAVRAD